MRKKWIYVACLIFSTLGIIGCSKENSTTKSPYNISEQIIGTLQDDVHSILGEPSGKLAGFTGDIYIIDNGTQIVFYYDDKMKVEQIKINAADGDNTLSISNN